MYLKKVHQNVMVSILASSAVDHGFQPLVKSKTVKFVFVALLLNTSIKE